MGSTVQGSRHPPAPIRMVVTYPVSTALEGLRTPSEHPGEVATGWVVRIRNPQLAAAPAADKACGSGCYEPEAPRYGVPVPLARAAFDDQAR